MNIHIVYICIYVCARLCPADAPPLREQLCDNDSSNNDIDINHDNHNINDNTIFVNPHLATRLASVRERLCDMCPA